MHEVVLPAKIATSNELMKEIKDLWAYLAQFDPDGKKK